MSCSQRATSFTSFNCISWCLFLASKSYASFAARVFTARHYLWASCRADCLALSCIFLLSLSHTRTCIRLILQSPNSKSIILAGSVYWMHDDHVNTISMSHVVYSHYFFLVCFLCGFCAINNFAFYMCLIFYIVGTSQAPHSPLVVSSSSRYIHTHPMVPQLCLFEPSLQERSVLLGSGWCVSVLSAHLSFGDISLSLGCLSPSFGV